MRRCGTLVAIPLIVLAAASCSSTTGPEQAPMVSTLRVPGDPTASAGAILPDVPIDGVRSFGVGVLCVTGKPVQVTGVTPVDPQGGLEVVGWGVRPSAFQTGGEGFGEFDGPIPAAARFVSDATAVVSGHCPATINSEPTETLTEVAVALRKGTGSLSSTSALRVSYSVDGRSDAATINFGVTLCGKADMSSVCEGAR